MYQESTTQAPKESAAGTAPAIASPAARAATEWRVTKDQLAAAERATRYHARRQEAVGGQPAGQHAA